MDAFADIEGPVFIGLWPIILLIAGGVLLIMLAALVLYRLVKRARNKPTVSIEPRRSPLEIALERLHRLKEGTALLEPEPFTVEVSDIVRDYLEEALEVPAREQTSEEFLNALSARDGMPEVLHASMPGFLECCDRVKFARQSLDARQQDSLLQTAETVVASTDAELRAGADQNQPTREAV